MTLLLSNEEIEQVLDMKRCLEVMEQAYQDLAAGRAGTGLRSDVSVPSSQPGGVYALKSYATAFPRAEVGAIRINSDLLTFRDYGASKQRHKIPAAPGDRYTGLILLFSTRTGEPLSIFPDGVVQRARVGATSGLGLKWLAREGSSELAIIGSGWQAGTQAWAACSVRSWRQIRVFSPNPEHREGFCTAWERKLGVPFLPVESASAAVEGADVVLCATNSMRPVLEAGWIRPGMHVGAIRLPEVPGDLVAKADVVFRHLAADLATYQVLGAVDSEDLKKDRGWDPSRPSPVAGLPDLADLIAGKLPGRTGPEQITLFLNNGGMGLQFAAVGHAVWKSARERGIGRELPTEWFTQTVHS